MKDSNIFTPVADEDVGKRSKEAFMLHVETILWREADAELMTKIEALTLKDMKSTFPPVELPPDITTDPKNLISIIFEINRTRYREGYVIKKLHEFIKYCEIEKMKEQKAMLANIMNVGDVYIRDRELDL